MIDRMYDELLDRVKQDFFATLDFFWRGEEGIMTDDPRDMIALLRMDNRFNQPLQAWLTEWEARHISEWKDAPK